MSEYKLYFLGPSGHVVRAKNLCCASDGEAVRLMLNHPRHGGMELWQGPKRLRSLVDPGLSEDRSPYSVYLLDDDCVIAMTKIDAPGDATACAIAGYIFRSCDDECGSYEVWQRDRWVESRIDGRPLKSPLDPDGAALTLAALEQKHQNLVVEREMTLRDSYQAIGRSRKLLDMLQVLKSNVGLF